MKKNVLVCSLIFLTFVASCTPLQSTSKDAAQAQQFRVGTEGIRAVFLQNLPPARIFDTEPLSVVLELENRGTASVGGPGDAVYLSGFDSSIITGIPVTGVRMPDIQPRDQFTPVGGRDTATFQARITSLKNKGIDRYPARLQATICYNYRTIASANACIDPNPFSATIQQKVCTPASVALGSQGAPVAVSIVEVDPALGKTRFRIRVQNVGAGEVFKPAALNKCSPYSEGPRFDEIDFVKVLKVNIQNRNLRCNPLVDQHLRLTGGTGTLFCEFDGLTGTATYISPLVVELEYGYRTTLLQSVDIVPGT